MKKILSITLVVTTILSLLCSFASAKQANRGKEVTDYDSYVYFDAVNTLATLDIVEGMSKDYMGVNEYLTRAQMCAIMVRALVEKEDIKVSTVEWEDVNVNAWYKVFIDTAYRFNIMRGCGYKKFAPEKNVTYAQVATIILNAVGYNSLATEPTWPQSVLKKANELNLFDDINITDYNAPCTRGEAMQIIYNAFDVCVNTYVGKSKTKDTFLAELGFKEIEPTITFNKDKVNLYRTYKSILKKNSKKYVTKVTCGDFIEATALTNNKFIYNKHLYKINWDKVDFYLNGEKADSNVICEDDEVTILIFEDKVIDVFMWNPVTYSPNDSVKIAEEIPVVLKNKRYKEATSTVTYFNNDYYEISNKYISGTLTHIRERNGKCHVVLNNKKSVVFDSNDFTVNTGDNVVIYFDYKNEVSFVAVTIAN